MVEVNNFGYYWHLKLSFQDVLQSKFVYGLRARNPPSFPFGGSGTWIWYDILATFPFPNEAGCDAELGDRALSALVRVRTVWWGADEINFSHDYVDPNAQDDEY